ncbi:MAG: ECF transporter S component [Bacillota bacterium]|nr:ECF transporter S component [Bacillota bacterium]
MEKSKTVFITRVAILSAAAFALNYIEFPVPLFPAFLQLDFSDIPALVGAFALGPLAGVVIEFIKNILHLIFKWNIGSPVGELANFIVGVALVGTAGFIYKKRKTKQNAIKAMIVGIIVMAVAGGVMNYFVLLPFYTRFMPIEAIIEMGAAVNNRITSLKDLVIYAIIPFNIFKGVIISVITGLLYKKLSPVIHK